MRTLIAVAAYPDLSGGRALYYVHSRNLYYKKSRIDVTVLDFSAVKDYEIDGIRVVSLATYERQLADYDILIFHAANLRNHYRFLCRYNNRFKKKLFIFHGHEVLIQDKHYPPPYAYRDRGPLRRVAISIYDRLKLRIWRRYFLKHIDDIRLIFVSDWLFRQFLEGLDLEREALGSHGVVISNGVGEFFLEHSYQPSSIAYDFITIRNYLDESKYGVDIVVRLAKSHPSYRFLVIGKGEFFRRVGCPDNLTWLDKELSHEDMKGYIDSARYALLPTREDTQGLMACEMAVYGIPLITSDIEICREVFEGCSRVALIDNDAPDLERAIASLDTRWPDDWDRYYPDKTIYREIEYIKAYVGSDTDPV